MPWLALFIAACERPAPLPPAPPPSEHFADPDLTHTGASAVLHLDGIDGRYELPPSTLPAGFQPTDRFAIALEPEPAREKSGVPVWRGPSPFVAEVEDEARVAAPPGMKLYVGDEEIPYSPTFASRTWKINEKHILVTWRGDAPPAVGMTYTEAHDLLLRRDFATAGLPPNEFVKHTVTIDAETRAGLLLPAPATARWDVTLPPRGATFESWIALAPLPIGSVASDGATVALTIASGDARTTAGTLAVVPGETFARWSVDLGAWAGKAVTLELASSPGATPDFDHVFLGSPTVWGPPDGDVRHVVIVGLDTTRPDHFGFYGYGRDTTPELDRIARSSTVFARTWTPAPRTRPSFRSAFTGRNPLDAVGSRNMADVFRSHGFATAGIVANVHLQPRFDFHQGFDRWRYDARSKVGEQVDRAIAWLEENRDRDAFLFLHVMDPHLFYNAPDGYRDRWVEDPDPDLPPVFTRWVVYDWAKEGKLDDRRKKHIAALYDGELSYTSVELGRFFETLDRLGPRTLVVVHSDHGEELWDHGEFEHNHTVYEETTRGLLWFRSGSGQRIGQTIDAPATLADIAPTLFELAGFTDTPPTDGRSLAPILLGTTDASAFEDRAIGVGHLRYGTERWGVVWRSHKYVLHTGTGREELYDLTTDPHETKNLAADPGTDTAPYYERLAEAHGMRVGKGWRMWVRLRASATPRSFTVALPTAVKRAEVIDPEALVTNPANQAWGEAPRRVPADIGTVALAADGRTLTFVPGPHPDSGLVAIVLDEDIESAGIRLQRDGETLTTVATPHRVRWSSGGDSIELVRGIVNIPPPSEAVRIAALGGPKHHVDADREMLIDLGYLEPNAPAQKDR